MLPSRDRKCGQNSPFGSDARERPNPLRPTRGSGDRYGNRGDRGEYNGHITPVHTNHSEKKLHVDHDKKFRLL